MGKPHINSESLGREIHRHTITINKIFAGGDFKLLRSHDRFGTKFTDFQFVTVAEMFRILTNILNKYDSCNSQYVDDIMRMILKFRTSYVDVSMVDDYHTMVKLENDIHSENISFLSRYGSVYDSIELWKSMFSGNYKSSSEILTIINDFIESLEFDPESYQLPVNVVNDIHKTIKRMITGN